MIKRSVYKISKLSYLRWKCTLKTRETEIKRNQQAKSLKIIKHFKTPIKNG